MLLPASERIIKIHKNTDLNNNRYYRLLIHLWQNLLVASAYTFDRIIIFNCSQTKFVA